MSKRPLFLSIFLLLLTLSAAAQDAQNLQVPQGCRRGTPRPQDMALHRGAANGQPRQPGGDFYKGDKRQLLVLVQFSDLQFEGDESATMQKWDKLFNAEGLSEAPYKGSVSDYFSDQSYQLFRPQFDLQYISLAGSITKYCSTAANDENSQYLVQDIIEVLKTRGIDWGQYDWNGDGYVNQLLIVYAGKGMNDGGGENSIWPHQWWMSEHLKDGQKGVYCDPIPVSDGAGKEYLVDCYCAVNEKKGNKDPFGTICHEYSHCFGLPDFYYGSKQYVSKWDLMDYGNYNNNGYTPASYSAHERWLMGWLTPQELTTATSVTNMPALSEEPKAYLVRNDGHSDEYYMVENRQQTKWDEKLPAQGVIIFHIDYDAAIWVSTKETPNHTTYKDDEGVTHPARQRYTIFAANNASSIAGWAYPYGQNNLLTNTSTPAATLFNDNTDGTKLMSKPLTNITVSGGLASFDFMGGSTDISTTTTGLSSYTILYRIGNVTIVRCSDGTVKKLTTHR